MPSCQIDFSLCDLANENPETAKQNFLQHVYTNYNDYLLFYADGSKTDFGTSSSFYIHRFEVRRVVKLYSNASIFTAELHASFKALYWISQNRYAKNLIISDSLSSIKAIHHNKNNSCHFLIDKVKLLHYFLDSIGVKITYMWVPSHAGIPGNETADFLGRSATTKEPQHDLPNSDIHLSISDIILMIKDHCFSIWQQQYVSNSTALKYKYLFRSITDRNSASSPFLFRLQPGDCKLNAHIIRIGLPQHRIMLNLFGSRRCQPFLVNLSEIRTLKICFKFTSKFHGFASHNANTILSTSLFKFNKFCRNVRSNRLN